MRRELPLAIRLGLMPIVLAVCSVAVASPAQPADTTSYAADNLNAPDDPDDLAKYGRLDQRIRAVAQRDGIAPPAVDAMIRIFADDIDLRRAAHPGDGFVVVTDDATSNAIVFASLTFNGQTESFYRFAPRGGDVDYFDRAGRSADKLLMRRPLNDGWLRARFGIMRHPILGTTRMHTGVDWEAPLGTPILAAGAGTIEIAGWDEGYGKTVRVRHGGGYVTAYAHLLKIAAELKPGVQVERGQVIGSVGSTGVSTGPHLHYEILVNGRFVDPARVRLPAQHVLAGATLDAFTVQRAEADSTRNVSFHALFPDK